LSKIKNNKMEVIGLIFFMLLIISPVLLLLILVFCEDLINKYENDFVLILSLGLYLAMVLTVAHQTYKL